MNTRNKRGRKEENLGSSLEIHSRIKNNIKILLYGLLGCGKSSLLTRLSENTSVDDEMPTTK